MKSGLFIMFSLQLATLGAAPSPYSLSLLNQLFEGDINNDQKISPKEFIWPAVLFATLDQNKDGFITQNEIKPLLPANPEELKKIWAYGLISRRTAHTPN